MCTAFAKVVFFSFSINRSQFFPFLFVTTYERLFLSKQRIGVSACFRFGLTLLKLRSLKRVTKQNIFKKIPNNSKWPCQKVPCILSSFLQIEANTNNFQEAYSRLPVTRTLYNSNLPLTRSNFHFSSDHFLHNCTLDNSNFFQFP